MLRNALGPFRALGLVKLARGRGGGQTPRRPERNPFSRRFVCIHDMNMKIILSLLLAVFSGSSQ